jgi:superfamily I DNA/RNA helicase
MNLTTEQNTAATLPLADGQIQLIESVAGSGKTTVAAARIRNLIAEGRNPAGIVAITYTRAGGKALRAKIGELSTPLGWVGTLNALAMRALNVQPEKFLTEAEEEDFVRDILRTLRLDKAISLRAAGLALSSAPGSDAVSNGNISLFVRRYRAELRSAGKTTHAACLLDYFDHLQGITSPPQILLVDEAQDTAPIDQEIYYRLRGTYGTIIIGDRRQSIFQFRGSSDAYIRAAARRGTITPLSTSFRCARTIVALANKAAGLTGEAAMRSARDHMGVTVNVRVNNQREEEDFLAHWATNNVAGGESGAILCRYNADVDRIYQALSTCGIALAPRVSRSEEKEAGMKALVNILRFIVAALDSSSQIEAGRNLINKLPWEIRSEVIEAAWKSLDYEIDLDEVLRRLETPSEIRAAAKALGLGRERFDIQGVRALIEAATDRRGGDEGEDTGIHVETIHGAKGREWDHVVLAAADSRLDGTLDIADLNLVYVAITRARDTFVALHASNIFDKFTGRTRSIEPSKIINSL